MTMTHTQPNPHNLLRSQETQMINPPFPALESQAVPPETQMINPPFPALEAQAVPPEISGNPVPQPALRLKARDLAVLKAFAGPRYLTANQIEALFWRALRGGELGTQRSAQRRLQQLRQ